MFEQRTLTDLDIELLKEQYPINYQKQIKKVKNGYPIQYLLGNVDFLNVKIRVNKNVLIPRFETEFLVEKVLKKIAKIKNESLKMLDICTGSGCIAISLAKNTNFKCRALDISTLALKLAKENSKSNNVTVHYQKLDILNEPLKENYDIIISNPPYIAFDETVDESVKYEPSLALYASDNGLIFYKKILEKIKNKPKLIAFEIGETHSNQITKLARQKFPTAVITTEKDLNSKDRYVFIEHI